MRIQAEARPSLRWFSDRVRVVVVGAAIAATVAVAPSARAQLPGLNLNASDAPTAAMAADAEVEFATAYAYLDGRPLFLISAPPRATEGSRTLGPSPVRQRVREIEQNLHRIAREISDPNAIAITSSEDARTGLPIIEVNGRYLMTVTSTDNQLQGRNLTQLTRTIETGLARSYRERQPEFLRRQGLLAGSLLVSAVVASWGLRRWRRKLMQHRDRVLAETTIPDPIVLEPDADAPIPEDEQQRIAKHNADVQKQKADLEQVKSRFDLLGGGARLAQVAVWGGAIGVGLGLFGPTRWLQLVLINVLSGVVLKVVAIALAVYVLVRVSFVAIDWLFAAIGNGEFLPDDASPRLTQRIQTFSVVLKGLASAGLTGIGFLMTLAVLGLDIGPILAGAGILGLAVSFGAQSLVKDVINGFLILLEDQYGVGDVIIVDSVAGLVERMNLRVTQLRSADGNLITIPNGSISVVQNVTNQWSRVNLGIDVAYNTDLDKAIAVIEQVARQMTVEPYWSDLILEPPTVLGVDAFGDNSITIRLWIRTKPLKHMEVGRQYRLRLKKAFDREGISIPFPQRSVWFENSLESKALMSGNGAVSSESGDRVALS